ncbi:EamA family transporter RarD [Luteolibacter yonseiensis]|uniref:EamA family transporter RarD n=1 Tax=Luteolibacter yonseiensis TaxID=1144680 RepID=A0A934R2B6_9BACT|nr:EamA family transporter RarD [Luteolibacter yonseiensis]MBK1815696.1 EamA family transporter RarD [Luteolibacter yonseiensis]
MEREISLCHDAKVGQIPRVDRTRSGVLAALAAFFLWGILPIFWKLLDFLPPPSIVAQRTVWSLLIVLAILWWKGEGRALATGMKSPRVLGWHFLSGGLLASNWLLYVWATLNGHIIEAALGYYLNPFFNMLFGALWFGDTNSRWQMAAIALALGGVALQVPAVGHFPWIAVVLALTFSLYAVVRKRAPLGSLVGLAAETVLLAPIGLVWLFHKHGSTGEAFGGSLPHAGLVIVTGFATALPLLFFGHATRTIRLTTLGILQFLGPTLQFFIGWKLYGEPMTGGRLVSFGLIWLAVGIYAADALLKKEQAQVK